MVPRIILIFWVYQVFFAEMDTEATLRFIASVPEELLVLKVLCILSLMPIFLVGIPICFGWLRVPAAIHGALMVVFTLLGMPIFLIDFWFGEGAKSAAPLFIFFGVLCNCLAVVGNKGKMPVRKEVLEKWKDIEIDTKLTDEEIFGDSRHSLTRGKVRFPMLIDRFCYPFLLKGIFSIGDALIGIGLLIAFFPRF